MLLTYFLLLLPLLTTVLSKLELTILHSNDIHGRFEEVQGKNNNPCTPNSINCLGGVARMVTEVRRIRKTYKNVLHLFAGNFAQGTPLYSLYDWNVSVAMLNMLQYDAITFGHHDFTLQSDGEKITDFAKNIKSPLISCNIESKAMKYSTIIEFDGYKIGIVGLTSMKRRFVWYYGDGARDELKSLIEECKKLKLEDGVNIIILLGPIRFKTAIDLVESVPLIDVVVFGDQKLLWNGVLPPHYETIEGPYPWIINKTRKAVPLVTTYGHSKYLGMLHLEFDDKSQLTKCNGQPILLSASIPKSQDVEDLLEKLYLPNVRALRKEIAGKTEVILDQEFCQNTECPLGNIITDAYVASYINIICKQYKTISIENFYDIRSSILPRTKGVTAYDVLLSIPFKRSLFAVEITGRTLRKLFENAVKNNEDFLHVSSAKVIYNLNRPDDYRVSSMQLKDCKTQMYKEVDRDAVVNVITTDYMLAKGGENCLFNRKTSYIKKLGNLTNQASLKRYLHKRNLVKAETEGRIEYVGARSFSNSLLRYYTPHLILLTCYCILFI